MKWKDWLSIASDSATVLAALVPFITWLITRKRWAFFWHKWGMWLFGIVGILTIVLASCAGWFSWLKHECTWPVWGLILLSLAVPMLLVLLFFLAKREPYSFDYRNYRQDRDIYGVSWHWEFDGKFLAIDSLTPMCPRPDCKCRLDLQRRFDGAFNHSVDLVCDHCGFRRCFDYSFDEVRRKVSREIERRVRTGEFEK